MVPASMSPEIGIELASEKTLTETTKPASRKIVKKQFFITSLRKAGMPPEASSRVVSNHRGGTDYDRG